MAGDPLAAIALMAIGYRSLSMSAAAIGPVKAMVLGLDRDLATLWSALLGETTDGYPACGTCAILPRPGCPSSVTAVGVPPRSRPCGS